MKSRVVHSIIPQEQALTLDAMKAWAKNLACQVGAFEVVDEIYADVEAWASGMEAAAVAYFEVALPNGAFAVGVPDAVAVASVEDFVDIPAADWL